MAALDKLYLKSKKEILEFYLWCEMFDDLCVKETQKSIMDYWYLRIHHIVSLPNFIPHGTPVINTPFCIDKWLWKHCPLPFIREEMISWWGYGKNKESHKKFCFYLTRSFDRDEWRKKKTMKELLEQAKCPWQDRVKRKVAYAIYLKIKSGKCQYNYLKRADKYWLTHNIW